MTVGAIEGRVQTLSTRHGLRFVLYDALHDKGVPCYLQEGQEELIRGLWDMRVAVEGKISRDSVTYRPLAIRDIKRIVPIPEVPSGSYRAARGAIPLTPEMLRPEQVIRLVRDAE